MVISPVQDIPARSAPRFAPQRGGVPTSLLVIVAMVSIQLGAVVAKHLFSIASPTTVACARIVLAGAFAMLLWRPALRVERTALFPIAGLGVAIAAMNVCFYAALDRIPLGMAVTIDFLGPLTIALIGSRRWRDALWVAFAGAGVLLLVDSEGPLSWTGVLFAMAAGVGWAAYIACSAVVGRHTSGHDGLALAMGFGALLALPPVIASGAAIVLSPVFLVGAATLAVLSSLVPHAIELEALRRITPAVFGVMMSLEPAVAAGVGLLLLGEELQVVQWLGIGLVVVACAGAARGPGETQSRTVSKERVRMSRSRGLNKPSTRQHSASSRAEF
ncbi:EamA family transporter [Nocardia sp. NBC_00508]|uniref:EamA family transporter n=1 Tax=Nocardia sp. NBC_00508 TaxID=2975992 RepID=UPI002E81BDDB|nr:EamA family transporter [Nocardia sp. NBC_00508]WUD66338.1 EamA family transporter [Nocardia sp. NBC_00508]